MTKKVLSLTEFIDVPQSVQFEVLHKHGVYVGKRKIDKQTVVLFQLHGFYVEVYYKHYRKVIDRLDLSDSTDMLLPYLDQVSIKGFNDDREEK
jgi:hypothetical protein